MALTEKQIAALSKVQNEGIVSIKGSVGLKDARLISTDGGAGRPGYLKASLTDAGKQHLRTLAI